MMSSKNWPNNKYYGKTSDEIKQLWEQNRDQAAEAGDKNAFGYRIFLQSNGKSKIIL